MVDPVERRPAVPGWREIPSLSPPESYVASSWWVHRRGILVGSDLVVAELPRGGGIGLQWLVSVSARGARPSAAEILLSVRAFGLEGWEEDAHHPGAARHFWCPLDPAERVTCQCKTTEVIVRDGTYAWTNPVDGPCRGCELERLVASFGHRRPCPLHPTHGARHA